MLKWALGIFVILGLGFWLGRSTAPVSEEQEELQVSEGGSDEIAALKRRIEELEKQNSNLAIKTPAKNSDPAEFVPSPPPIREESQKEDEKAASTSEPPKQWRAVEKNIAQVRTPQELSNFLEKAKIDDFMAEVQNVQPFTASEEILEYLNGAFTGVMTSASEVPGFNIALNANLRMEGRKLKGRTNIRLSRNGRTFSRGSSNGDIESVQKFKDRSLAVVIYSGDYYFQLYYMPALETFEGNCYQQFKPGQMRYLGTVHLERI